MAPSYARSRVRLPTIVPGRAILRLDGAHERALVIDVEPTATLGILSATAMHHEGNTQRFQQGNARIIRQRPMHDDTVNTAPADEAAIKVFLAIAWRDTKEQVVTEAGMDFSRTGQKP